MAESVTALPRFIALKGDNEMFLALKPDGLLTFDAPTMSRLTTHEVLYNLDEEGGTFIIRSQNNRFWRRDPNNWIRADHEGIPESSATLTRFKLADLGSGKLALRSVTDNFYLKRLHSSYHGYNASVSTPDAYTGVRVSDASELAVRLPRYVYFKGDNGKYLHVHDDTNQLSYKGQDPGNLLGISEVFHILNGAIALYSPYKGRFWREFPDSAQPLVLAQATSDNAMNPSNDDCHFEPMKLSSSITALRCKRSNKFCKRQAGLSADNLQTLGTSTSNDTATHMTLTEAVIGSYVFDVSYLLQFASTTEQSPIAVAEGSMNNSSPFMTDLNVVVTIRQNLIKSRSFSNSFTFSQSVSTAFSAGVPFLADGKIEVQIGFEQNFSSEWSETKEEEIQYQTQNLVKNVPPGGTAAVRVVASMAKMRIPFTYKCKDTAPDGTDRPTETRIDGIFDGVDAYKIEAEITGSVPSYTVPANLSDSSKNSHVSK